MYYNKTTSRDLIRNLMEQSYTTTMSGDFLTWVNSISSLRKQASEEEDPELAEAICEWGKAYCEMLIRFVTPSESYVYQLIDSSNNEESIGYFNSFKNAFETIKREKYDHNHTFIIYKHPVNNTPDDYGFKDPIGICFNADAKPVEIITNQYFWIDEILTNVLYNN